MEDLANKVCVACEGGTPPLTAEQIAPFLERVSGWEVRGGKAIVKKWQFSDFASALARVDAIGAIAEREGHHPDIAFGWGRLEVALSTHSIGGLSENDFILAAKIDALSS